MMIGVVVALLIGGVGVLYWAARASGSGTGGGRTSGSYSGGGIFDGGGGGGC